jgi:hypothetical protein
MGDWVPKFGGDDPPHWLAVVNTRSGVRLLSDRQLDLDDRRWLAEWLSNYHPRDPDIDFSYIYVGLSDDITRVPPDGLRSDAGVTGFGGGEGFGEPPGAVPSTVAALVAAGVEALRRE